jgi:hypothetical protein
MPWETNDFTCTSCSWPLPFRQVFLPRAPRRPLRDHAKSWADYYHRRHFQALGAFGPFGVAPVDRQPKAAIQGLQNAFAR